MTLIPKDVQKVALIIFVRKAELGKVKTRLARSLGDQKALLIYKILLEHTRDITLPLECSKFVYYSTSVPDKDIWNEPLYESRAQEGESLGERMSLAFREVFARGFDKALIIGSDCYQLSTPILRKAIEELETHEAVIGPAKDGGYYLLGTTRFIPELFQGKLWSTEMVTKQTIQDFEFLKIEYHILEILNDIDEESDLEKSGFSFPYKI